MLPRTFVQAEERLAETLPGYESRPQQQALAAAVEEAIVEGRHLLAEAGTGTGKSLGYLIPAILSGKRVIVSTATKALQDQIALKDLPFLQDNLGVQFWATILKGRGNYVCFNRVQDSERLDDQVRARVLSVLENQPTPAYPNDLFQPEFDGFSGERDQFGIEIGWADWYEIASEADDCKDCGWECYAYRAREKAKVANIVVVNHALYMTDLMVKEVSDGFASFLGPHEVVVFDEAHEIEEYASSSLGRELKLRGIEFLMREINNFHGNYDRQRIGEADRLASAIQSAARRLWDTLEPGRIRQNDVLDREDEFVALNNAFVAMYEFMAEKWPATTRRSDSLMNKRGSKIRRKVESMGETILKIIMDPFADTVRWVEEERTPRSNEKITVLKYAPIDVGPYLRRMLFGGHVGITAILTSATLKTNGGFGYIAGRLGIDEYDDLDVGTPFDYPNQAKLYIPTDLPDPAQERAAWSNLSVSRMRELLTASDGRALLLFTSYAEMRNAYDSISPLIPHTCMMQGQDDNKVLAERFKEDIHSVLFATRSFMTGFDVQGESLSLVVVNKMPFPVPTEALTEARTEAIEARGGNSFRDYSIPVMTLVLKQAFGRLIRHRNDRGVVAILDPRLVKKGYGKAIVKVLPDAELVHDMEAVREMFERVPA